MEVLAVEPLNNSELSQKKQQEDIVRLNFILTAFVDLKIGDYMSIPGTTILYTLNKKPSVVESPNNYQYECIFEGGLHELVKTKAILTTVKLEGGFYTDYQFPLTGTIQSFLSFIVGNLNRTGAGYSAGTFKESTSQTIQFNNWNIFEAITALSEQLNFSWYLAGKVLHFKAKDYESPHVFQVGQKMGFVSLTRTRVESETVETVVYGYGSTLNLPLRSEYDSPLLTENRLFFEGTDGESKLTNNVNNYGIIESVQVFDEIKPEFNGSITAIGANINTFIDSSIDFDLNDYLLEGTKPKVYFLSGTLLGLTFNISFNNTSKSILLDNLSNDSGEYPNTTIKPAVGDFYIFIDTTLPNEYISAAELRLKAKIQEYVNEQSTPKELYSAKADEEFIQRLNISLTISDLIRVVSPTFQIDNLYEIKELTKNINNPYLYALKFGDIIPKSLLATLALNNFKTEQSILNIQNNTYTTNQANNQTINNIGTEVAWETL